MNEIFTALPGNSQESGEKPSQMAHKLPYRQPQIYSLGSLDKVQAYYTGTSYDGPNSWYWYS